MIPLNLVYIALTYEDGSVGVMQFVTVGRGNVLPDGAKWIEGTGHWSRDPTPAAVEAEVKRSQEGVQFVSQVVSWRYADYREFPESRRYRDAWRDVAKAGGKGRAVTERSIVVDMEAAREVHRDHIRRARLHKWPDADAAAAKALEEAARDPKSRAVAAKVLDHKQALRDATDDPRIDAAKTPEELEKAWPDVLTGLEGSWR